MLNTGIVISGTGLYTPSYSISNDELVAALNIYVERFNAEHQAAIDAGQVEALQPSNSEFIERASGIKSRYVVEKSGVLNPEVLRPYIPERSNDELSLHAEISIKAIEQALLQAGRRVEDVDAVIAACSNFPRAYPALSIEVQTALGIEGFAFDMNVACSSATFGIQQAYNMICAGNAKCVVMVNPEITSGHSNFFDRDSHFIFGDVCTAVVIERMDGAVAAQQFEILGVKLATQMSNNIRNNFGYLNPCDPDARKDDKLFSQEGRKVFKEVVPMVINLIEKHLAEKGIRAEQLRRLWLHQANINMNVLIAKKLLGQDVDRVQAPVVLDEYANTSSAGSIIAHHMYKDDMQAGDYGIICSFGAGYSIGNVILKLR